MHRIAALYRTAYTGLSRATWWLSIVMCINRCGTMVVPFMTLYLTQQLHYTIDQAGIVFAIVGLGAVCGGFAGGRLSGLFGFHKVQLVTLFFGGLMFIVLGYMQSFRAICICTFLLGLINESFRPANSLAIAHYSSAENRTRSYSLNRLAINVGWAAGGALGGFIAGRNYHLLFWIDGFTNIGAALMLFLLLRDQGKAAASEQKTQPAIKAGHYEAYRDKRYLGFIIFTFLYAFCFFQLFSTQPVFYRESLHLSERIIGITMALNGVMVAAFEMVLVHSLEGKRPPLKYIVPGAVLIAVSFAMFNAPVHVIIIAFTSLIIVTAGEMLSMPFMNTYWLSRTTDNNRAGYAGLYTVAWAAAQVLGPYCGGQIAGRIGYGYLWWIISGLCLVAALGYKILQVGDGLTGAKQ